MAMAPWRHYQEDVAALLTDLGFATKVPDVLAGLTGTEHEVDVSARRTVAGVDVLWIVACKLWQDRVPKEKVAALSDIVTDLHADRGLLMSKSGFQSGAIQLASGRAVTLSSLEDLRDRAADELLAARLDRAEQRARRPARTLLQPGAAPDPGRGHSGRHGEPGPRPARCREVGPMTDLMAATSDLSLATAAARSSSRPGDTYRLSRLTAQEHQTGIDAGRDR